MSAYRPLWSDAESAIATKGVNERDERMRRLILEIEATPPGLERQKLQIEWLQMLWR